jgi:hypothetical protein
METIKVIFDSEFKCISKILIRSTGARKIADNKTAEP